MLLGYIIRNMKRSAVTNALFCVLLALAGALFALASGLWYSAYRSERNLENIITTIAIPDRYAVRAYADDYVVRNNITQFETQTGEILSFDQYGDYLRYYVSPYVQIDVMNEINKNVFGSGLFDLDDRRVYGAYVPGFRSIPVRMTEKPTTEFLVEYSAQSTAAFIVYCDSVEEVYELETQPRVSLTRSQVAYFTMEDEVYLHSGRLSSRTITGYFPYANPDGSHPVEAGKRYLIIGYDYSQGSRNASWYSDRNILPPNLRLPNALRMDIISANHSELSLGVAGDFSEIDNSIVPWMVRAGIETSAFPVDIITRVPVLDQALGYEGYTWFEMEGSLEEALDSEQGRAIRQALSLAGISYNSLQVITTNDINSFLRFNQRTNRIMEGRLFSDEEKEAGARVCLVSGQIAELNGLSPGDKIQLQLYPAALTQLSIRNDIPWPWSPYHPSLGMTEPMEYEIVGIYLSLTQEMRDHAISPNTVFIPAASFDGIDAPPMEKWPSQFSPPLLDTIIVPNDKVQETKALLEEATGPYSVLFRFYDQGYSSLKPILSNLRYGMSWIAALSAVGWVIAITMFSLFYIGRRKGEMVLLTALGVSRKKCIIWVTVQCVVVIVVAQCIVLGLALPLFDNILDTAISASRDFTESYRNLILSELNESGGLKIQLPLDRTMLGLMLAVFLQLLLLVGASVAVSAKAANRKFGGLS